MTIIGLSGEVSEEEKLAQASTKVIFESVEKLGSHKYEAKIRRTEQYNQVETSSHDEEVHIEWKDWDNFRYVRIVDNKEVSSTIVVDHIPYKKIGASTWKKYEDAESDRTQLRSSWNTWEQYLKTYEPLLKWTPLGEEEQEGRKVHRFALSLDPQKSLPPKTLQLKSIEGSVSIDQETAVRIYSEVQLVLVREGYQKNIRFALKRFDIQEEFSISPPE